VTAAEVASDVGALLGGRVPVDVDAEAGRQHQRRVIGSEEPPSIEDLMAASGNVGHFLRLMEQEIIQNQDLLLKANWLLRRYRRITQEDIDNPAPRPEGPFMHGARSDEKISSAPTTSPS
jgi:hypothetical protein